MAEGEALVKLVRVDRQDARLAMSVVGPHGDLPAVPRPRRYAEVLERQGEQAAGHLFAGGDHRVVFPGIVKRRRLGDPFGQLIGDPGHGGNHHGDLMAVIDRRLDPLGHGLDTVDIAN
jgi:hypothetical protein